MKRLLLTPFFALAVAGLGCGVSSSPRSAADTTEGSADVTVDTSADTSEGSADTTVDTTEGSAETTVDTTPVHWNWNLKIRTFRVGDVVEVRARDFGHSGEKKDAPCHYFAAGACDRGASCL